MPTADLILAVHDHQPVGQFDDVLAAAFARAYLPFLDVLERHPAMRLALHQSGPVWEWMETHHADALVRLRRMVEAGRVELLGGGWYEPILVAIPEADRRGQLEKTSAWLAARFGVRPRGAWIAERVWEPELAATLVRAGLEYCILDDAHLTLAGVPESHHDGHHSVASDAGDLGVFAIRRSLRYAVPFASVGAALAEVQVAAAAPGRAARPVFVLGDDGEKFGLWGATHERCYRDGWLDEWFARLAAGADGVVARTFADVFDAVPARGRVRLPAASYAEMMHWSLPPARQRQARDAAAADGAVAVREPPAGAALLGPAWTWKNFHAKYPESARMHCRMLATSAAVERAAEERPASDPAVARAREAVWRAQCGDASWHGMFGGLYLPHLRGAVYAALLDAESALGDDASLPAAVATANAAGGPEIRLRSAQLQAFVRPDDGGAIVELDDLQRRFNLLDLLARRDEPYHDLLRGAPAGAAHVPAALVYDPYRRGACIDHAFDADATPEDFDRAALPELATLAGAPYTWRLADGGVWMQRDVLLAVPGAPVLHVAKHVRLDGAALELRYALRLAADAPLELRFGIEMALNLRAGAAPDRWFEVPGRGLAPAQLASRGAVAATTWFRAVDTWLGLRVTFETDAPMDVWRTPLETVSMSEQGCERVYQGSALLFHERLHLVPGITWTRVLRQSVGST